MSAQHGSVRCRLANLDDYDSVIALRKDDLDYLVDKYYEILQRQDCRAYVAVVDQEVVAFAALQLTSNTSHVTGLAVRVQYGLRGRGIFNLLRRFSLSDFRTAYPKVKYITAFIRDSTNQKKRQILSPQLYRNVEKYYICTWIGRLDIIQTFMKDEVETDTAVSVNYWIKKRGDPSSLRFSMSLKGRFIYGLPWVSDTLNCEAVFKVSKTYSLFLTIKGENECVSLSTSYFYFSRTGWVINLFYFGDTDFYRHHLIRHILSGWTRMKSRDPRLNIMLLVPRDVDLESLQTKSLEMGLTFIETYEQVEIEQPLELVLSLL